MANEKDMPLIKFGHTINLVSIDNLVNLLKVCVGRVNIDIQGTNLKSMLLNSRYKQLVEIADASLLSQENKDFLFCL